jgi:hypothetical protein
MREENGLEVKKRLSSPLEEARKVMVNRMSFLRHTGEGMLLLGALSLINSCNGKNAMTFRGQRVSEVQWILRIGYLESYPDPVSLRMPASWFVQT